MIEKFSKFCIRQRVSVALVVGLATLFMAVMATRIEFKTEFSDLMPQKHPYIQVHNKFKESFGGSNMVSIMLEVDEGDIFNLKVLRKLQQLTIDLQMVQGVNQFQIISLASKKLKEVTVTTDEVNTKPIMFPDLPKDETELARVKEKVLQDPLIYGVYVSRDMKSALVTADFYDQLVDYDAIFKQINGIADKIRGDGVKVRVVGEPILYGWVKHFFPETFRFFLLTIGVMIIFLFAVSRTWRGTFFPLLSGFISACWALGMSKLLGFSFDPLVIVVAFLITARCISHTTQIVTHFNKLVLENGIEDVKVAAQMTMRDLFKPGILGLVTDAGGMILVAITPIPLLQKIAIVGTMWVTTIIIGSVVLTPVLLSWTRNPKKFAHSIDLRPYFNKVLNLCISSVTGRGRYAVLVAFLGLLLVTSFYSTKITVGDANPGSPILWGDSIYNTDAAAVNSKFRGSDRMFVAYTSIKSDAMKQPEVLNNMLKFQRFMEAQPEIGGSYSLADVIPTINRVMREDNLRYEEISNDWTQNGESVYMLTSGSDPGDIDRFADTLFKNGSVQLFFRDHRGDTIRTAISRIREFSQSHPLKDVQLQLAGGFVGVLAAINEIILSGQVESIAFALLMLVVCCAVTYRSSYAGMFFMLPVLLANTLTFAFMTVMGIGMNINTVPVAAMGIGLGVDYAIYIVDRIKENMLTGMDLSIALKEAMLNSGFGVMITAGALVCSILFWCFSSLRFQAEMGILIGIWFLISSVSALLLTPAMVFVFQPEFVVGKDPRKEL